jgi:hypothetical protein
MQPAIGVKESSKPGWGTICGPNCFEVYEAGQGIHATDIPDSVAIGMGALFKFLKEAWNDVKKIFFDIVDGVQCFFVWIGGKIYRAVLNTIEAVFHAIEFVFTQIKVFFDKLVAWIGFLFSWGDILRTHRVFKNISLQYAQYAIKQIDVLAEDLQAGFKTVKNNIDEWAELNLPGSGKSIGEQKNGSDPGTEMTSPQNIWAAYHTSNGIGTAKTPAKLPDSDHSGLEDLFRVLETAVKEEEVEIKKAVQQIKDEVATKFMTLSPEQVIKKVLAIVAKFVIGFAENLSLRLLELVKMIVGGLLDLLTAPLEIPVISWVYKNVITEGDELSVLDLVCLVSAIPATIIFKAVTNRNPFPDNSHTKALINATDFDDLMQLLSGGPGGNSSLASGDETGSATEEKPATGKIFIACMKLYAIITGGLNATLAVFKQTGLDKTAVPIRVRFYLPLVCAQPTFLASSPSI